MSKFLNLVDLLEYRTENSSLKNVFTILKQQKEFTLNYQQLNQYIKAIAAKLQLEKLQNQRAILIYNSEEEFIKAFFGCLYSKVIAVPTFPPFNEYSMNNLLGVLKNAETNIILTNQDIYDKLSNLIPDEYKSFLKIYITDKFEPSMFEYWQPEIIKPDSLAFLQYTSGSTSSPKGVMVSHNNLIHNQEMIKKNFGNRENDLVFGWLPLYHDMGLIGILMNPIYNNYPAILTSPFSFLKDPLIWLQSISKYKVTLTGGPNFGYELCNRKISNLDMENIDLSSLRLVFSGAEPIRNDTMQKFVEKFSPYGLSKTSVLAVYGMAEATLFISGNRSGTDYNLKKVSSTALQENCIQDAVENEDNIEIVSCGTPVADCEVIIVQPENNLKLGENEVGEIWVKGSNVSQGYWNNPELNQELFHAYIGSTDDGPYLRTGDLGFISNGELYIAGRFKDLIIINGKNHYPQDIELTVEKSSKFVRPGCISAFSVESDNRESLIVLVEVYENVQDISFAEEVKTISAQVSEKHNIKIEEILFLKEKSLLKTSSGKIQRSKCKNYYQKGKFVPLFTSKNINSSPEDVVTVNSVNTESSLKETGKTVLNSNLLSYSAQSGFYGNINSGESSTEKTNKLIGWLREYAEQRINSRLIDERRTISPHIILDMGNHGLMGMQVPESYGGLGLSHYDTRMIMEQLGAIDISLSLFIGLNNILGIRPILNFASQEIKEKFLPILAKGRELAAFALTEPGAGSNPNSISAKSQQISENRWKLNGTKIWSGGATWAGFINTFAKEYDHNGNPRGITAYLLRQGTKGLIQGGEALTTGMRGSIQNTIYFKDLIIDQTNILGEPGKGMHVANATLLYGRLTIASACIGAMKRCLQLIERYASRRSIASGILLDNPVTMMKISEITFYIDCSEVLVNKIVGLLDQENDVNEDLYTIAKILVPEWLWQTSDNLIQILGGRGYIETNIAPQIMRDARVLRVFEGPTETLKVFLGSKMLNNEANLYKLFVNQLNDSDGYNRIKSSLEQINKNNFNLFANDSANSLFLKYLISDLICFAVIESLLQTEANNDANTFGWIKLKYQETFNKINQNSNFNGIFITSKDSISSIINSYQNNIGNIEQKMAGEERELDPYLQKEPKLADKNDGDIPPGSDLGQDEVIAKSAEEQITENHDSNFLEIADFIKNYMVHNLGIPAEKISLSKPFPEYGLDSVNALEIIGAIEKKFSITLYETVIWDYTTIEDLAKFIAKKISDEGSTNKVKKNTFIKQNEPGNTIPKQEKTTANLDPATGVVHELLKKSPTGNLNFDKTVPEENKNTGKPTNGKAFILFEALQWVIYTAIYSGGFYVTYKAFEVISANLSGFLTFIALVPLIYLFLLTIIMEVWLLRIILPAKLEPGYHDAPKSKAFAAWTINFVFNRALYIFDPVKNLILYSLFLRYLSVRALGGKISLFSSLSANVNITDFPMLSIGQGSVIGASCMISGHFINAGKIALGKVEIGKNVNIGAGTHIAPFVKIGDNTEIGAECRIAPLVQIGKNCIIKPMSVLPQGTRLSDGEVFPRNN